MPGHKIVACAAKLLGWTEERVCLEAGVPLLLASSVKTGLDLNWSDPDEKAEAIPTLLEQLTNLEQWVGEHLPEELNRRDSRSLRLASRSSPLRW
jgi:hypothetical protein